MCVLSFDLFKHLLLRKTDVLKTCRKRKFLGKKISRNALVLRRYIREDYTCIIYHLVLLSSAVFLTQNRISFKLFCSGDKRFLSEFLRKRGWFQGYNKCFPRYFGWKLNFKKLRHGFVDERALTTTTLISSCHWKALVPFCSRKKRPENAFLILIVSYRKIVLKNRSYHSKQKWICYLMIYDAI